MEKIHKDTAEVEHIFLETDRKQTRAVTVECVGTTHRCIKTDQWVDATTESGMWNPIGRMGHVACL